MPVDPLSSAQGAFDTAFNEAATQPPDLATPLPYYPAARYVNPDKPLAPEKRLTHGDVAALAKARQQAESAGVLTPELGAQLLPMAMVEGRSGNYGIRQDAGFPATPANISRFKKLNLGITDYTDPKVIEADRYDSAESVPDPMNPGQTKLQYFRHSQENSTAPIVKTPYERPVPGPLSIYSHKGGKLLGLTGEGNLDPNVYARVMAGILAHKASVDPTKTVEGAVKLYNGKGKAMEKSDGKVAPADVDVYLKKVQEASTMLAHPQNKGFMDYFNSHYIKPKR